MKRVPYDEGTWFAVPLRAGGYAVGLVARKSPEGVLLGYFFGPRRDLVPSLSDLETLRPEETVLIRLFGDLGLLEGEWPIIGQSPTWDRRSWPLPQFGRIEEFTGRALRVEYDEENLARTVRETPATREEVEGLPLDGMSGYGALEKRLTRLLSV
jgi:hypothetical protein